MRTPCSAVIPARNAAATLGRAVESLLRQSHQPEEIVIAVGPSEDDTDAVARVLARTHDSVRVVQNPVGSIPHGLNLGFAAAKTDVIVRLDAHATLPTDYVEKVVEALEQPEVAVAGGCQFAVGTTPTERAVAAALMSPFGAGGAAFHVGRADPGPVDTVYLGAFDRHAFEAVGGFDESLLANEDYELNWRLRRAGFEIWLEPSLRVRYQPRGSVRELAGQFWRYGWWKREMLARHPRSVRARQVAAPALVLGMLGCLLMWRRRARLALLPPLGYLAANIGAALTNPHRLEVQERALLAVVQPTMHLAWGSGFLGGTVAAGVRRLRADR